MKQQGSFCSDKLSMITRYLKNENILDLQSHVYVNGHLSLISCQGEQLKSTRNKMKMKQNYIKQYYPRIVLYGFNLLFKEEYELLWLCAPVFKLINSFFDHKKHRYIIMAQSDDDGTLQYYILSNLLFLNPIKTSEAQANDDVDGNISDITSFFVSQLTK